MSGGVSIEIGRGEGVKKDLQWSEMDLLGWVRLRVCVCWEGGGIKFEFCWGVLIVRIGRYI